MSTYQSTTWRQCANPACRVRKRCVLDLDARVPLSPLESAALAKNCPDIARISQPAPVTLDEYLDLRAENADGWRDEMERKACEGWPCGTRIAIETLYQGLLEQACRRLEGGR